MADTAGFTAAVLCCACGGGARSTACPISDTTPLFRPCRCAVGATNECPAGSYCLPSGVCSLGGGRVVIGDAFLAKDRQLFLLAVLPVVPIGLSCIWLPKKRGSDIGFLKKVLISSTYVELFLGCRAVFVFLFRCSGLPNIR